MHQLNYSRYVIQGGDNGGIILRYQAALFPDIVVSMLSNFWTINPSEADKRRDLARRIFHYPIYGASGTGAYNDGLPTWMGNVHLPVHGRAFPLL